MCHLQCTGLRQFTTRYCVIFNVPVSDSSPPDSVSSSMYLFQTVHHQILCHLQCTCLRQFTTRYCVICNVPVSAPKTVRHQMSVSSAMYRSQTVHHQIVCHLQCTCFRQFTTRYCVIFSVPVSDSSPPDIVSSSAYLSQTVHHHILCHLQCACFRRFTTRYCVICNVPVSDSSPPDIVSSSMYLSPTLHHQILCHLQCTCFSPQDSSPLDSVPVQQRQAAFRKSCDVTYGQELDGLRTALHPRRALLAVQLPLRHRPASGRGRQLQFIPGQALGPWLRCGLCLERV